MFWSLRLFDPEMAVLSHCTYWRVVSSSVDGVTFASPVSLDPLPPAHHCSLETREIQEIPTQQCSVSFVPPLGSVLPALVMQPREL